MCVPGSKARKLISEERVYILIKNFKGDIVNRHITGGSCFVTRTFFSMEFLFQLFSPSSVLSQLLGR